MMAALSTTDCSHHLFGLTHSNNNQKQVATEPRLGGAFCRAKRSNTAGTVSRGFLRCRLIETIRTPESD